jgi:capsular exopolysaccharide synthesis family protein
MGKIHDALQRAEQERAKAGAAPAGVTAVHEALDPRIGTGRRASGSPRGEKLSAARRSRIMIADADASVTEEYRKLRARIQSLRRTRPIRSIVVTSALPGEGKTTTAVNLALSFGFEREGRTCLVDADLRTPAVHHALIESPEVGLAEFLELDLKLEEALIRVPDTRLSVLTVQAIPARPSELLASQRMTELIQELHSCFDTVIIDSAPVLGLPDATTLVDLCDAVTPPRTGGDGADDGAGAARGCARRDDCPAYAPRGLDPGRGVRALSPLGTDPGGRGCLRAGECRDSSLGRSPRTHLTGHAQRTSSGRHRGAPRDAMSAAPAAGGRIRAYGVAGV